MKWLIASDIHGDSIACEKIITAFEREKADRMLLLGDLLYHGPRNDLPEGYAVREVYAQLNAYAGRISAVRGNCDAEVDQMVLDFPMRGDYLQIPCGTHTIFATHGHVYGLQNIPELEDDDVLLCGHTHVAECRSLGRCWYMNPGSASMPKNNTAKGYILLDTDTCKFIWKTLDGSAWMEKTID